MAFGLDIGNILKQYTGGNADASSSQVEQDFEHVAQNSPHEDLANGLSEAFRSNETPPFGNMVSHLFSQADPQQKTGMVNRLLGALGPSGISSLLQGGLGGGVLGSLLQKASGQPQPQLSEQDVQQLDPEQVQQLAHQARQHDPSIIDQMSQFYAAHPTLVKALGGAALAIALGKIGQRNNG